jgi:hypothetical protein
MKAMGGDCATAVPENWVRLVHLAGARSSIRLVGVKTMENQRKRG